jgi:UDPglucose--hexose-1-phosphate uridylyltransferase
VTTHEVRVDPLTGLRTIVAGGRAQRPGAWPLPVGPPAPTADADADDPFAPGHEHETPPELDAVRPADGARDGPGWRVRVVPNRYPAVVGDAPAPSGSHDPGLYASRAARGAHEVIVNAPDAVTSLGDLPPAQVELAMDVWRRRMAAHAEAAYVHLFVNEGAGGGASQPHTHAQLLALDFVPAQVARERERFTAHATRTMGGNLLQDLVADEVRQRERVVAIDDEAVLLSPYAARVPYQLLLAPRSPRARYEDAGPLGAALLHDALSRLRRRFGGAVPPLNLWVRTAPRDAEHFCWRIDVLPRLTHLSGLELGTGVHLNVIAPEQAAAELRDA